MRFPVPASGEACGDCAHVALEGKRFRSHRLERMDGNLHGERGQGVRSVGGRRKSFDAELLALRAASGDPMGRQLQSGASPQSECETRAKP
jgi:hypothetical protein